MATPAFNPSASYSIPSFDPTAAYQTADAAASPQDNRNFIQKGFDRLVNVTPQDEAGHSALFNRAQEFGAGAIQGLGSAVVHPLDTLEGIGHTIAHPVDTATALARSAIQNPAQAAGNLVGGALLGEAGAAATRAVAPTVARTGAAVRDLARPTSSPAIVAPTETAARNLAKAVVPPTRDAQPFIQAAQKEVPNVIEYAKQTNNPLNTQLEFAKAAQGHAQAVRSFYEDSILKPNDKVVSVAGTGYDGPTVGEGQNAKLSDIDKRIGDINKELGPSYSKINVGDVRESLASKGALQREAFNLTRLLHQKLADSTGLTPDQIADIRQQVGRSYELANDTDAAVTARMQGEGRSALGELTWAKLPARAVEFVRGGPTAIGDRAFQRAISDFPGAATPLPAINPPVATVAPRVPIWQGLEPELRPQPTLTGDAEAARQLMQKRLAARRAKKMYPDVTSGDQ